MTIELNQLAAAIDQTRDFATDILAGWVRCQSTLGHEQDAMAYIAKVYGALGLDVAQVPVDNAVISRLPGYSPMLTGYAGRSNVVATHTPGTTTGKSLIFNGHVDVVSAAPEALWQRDPFEPAVFSDENGEQWMNGRGAGDMKGGMVCAIWAWRALQSLGRAPAARVLFESVIEEECTGNGTLALCADGYGADAVVIPEPFDQTILHRQAGVLWFDVTVLGKTTHVLGTRKGVNAIDKAWHIYRQLRQKLEAPMNATANVHPAYRDIDHPINLNLGVIQGGDWPSTVAGDCTMRFRMGLLPGTTCDEMRHRIQAVINDATGGDPWLTENPPKVVFRGFAAEPCEVDTTHPAMVQLARSHHTVEGKAALPLNATCTTDVRFFNLNYNTVATCYGPRARHIHGADECVSIDSMRQVALVMAHFITEWCHTEEVR
jgi:acetylornithine deacetylase